MKPWLTKEKLEGRVTRAAAIEAGGAVEKPTVYDGFLRGVPGRHSPPATRFPVLDKVIKDLEFKPAEQSTAGRIFLGLLDARAEEMTHKPGRRTVGGRAIGIKDDRHIVTIAGSRSGKGRSVLVPNLLTYPGSMLVIDPKGDLASITTHHREKGLKHEVRVLDPFGAADVDDAMRATFNPMTTLSRERETLIEDAALIADALVPVTPGNSDPHWDESAKHFIETLLVHIATDPAYGGPENPKNLLTLARLVGESTIEMGKSFALKEELLANTQLDGYVVRGARGFYDRSERERMSVLSTVRRHLQFLEYKSIKGVLDGPGSINLADLKRKKTTVYLTLPARHMANCSRWLRLFVNLTLAAAEETEVNPDNPHPVLLCLDEFAVLGTMRSIEEAAGQIAGFNVLLWPVLQDLGQLKSLYQERWETFLGNAGTLQFFGNNDVTTLEWISKRLGHTRAFNTNRQESTWSSEMNQAAEKSFAEASHPLLSVDEIARFFGRDDEHMRQLIIRPTSGPMVLQRVIYDEHELFAGKFRERAVRA